MNIRKRNTLARKLAIPGAALLAGLSVSAHAEPGTYSMVVLKETRYARSIMSLDYERTMAAIHKLEDMGLKTFNVYNNLCVGYTMTRSFDKARVACDAAIEAHDVHQSDPAPYLGFGNSSSGERREAIALTNRGVLKAVSGDLLGARDDFTMAAGISSEVTAAGFNMERLSAKLDESKAIAQVER